MIYIDCNVIFIQEWKSYLVWLVHCGEEKVVPLVTYIHRQGNLQFHSECILGDCCENNIHNENLEKQSLVYRTKQQLINARHFLANHSSSILLNEMRWTHILAVLAMGSASRWGGRFGPPGGVDCLPLPACGEGPGIYWSGYNKKIHIKHNCKDTPSFIDPIFH